MTKNKGKLILTVRCFLLSCRCNNYTSPLFHQVLIVCGICFLILRYWNLFMLPSASKGPSPPFLGLSNSLLLLPASLFSQNPNQTKKKPWLAIMLRWGKTICKLLKAHARTQTEIKQSNHFKVKAIIRTVCIKVGKNLWQEAWNNRQQRKKHLLHFFFLLIT